jgi:hypothetical protein
LQLAIDVGIGVACLGMTESTIVVVGMEGIATWSIAGGHARTNIGNTKLQITGPDCSSISYPRMTMSPDLSRIAIWNVLWPTPCVEIYDVSTGRYLARAFSSIQPPITWLGPWFTSDGHEIWHSDYQHLPIKGWKVLEDGQSGATKLQALRVSACPSGVLPWMSSRGYEVTDDWWVLSPTRRRLLWLPHRWRLEKCHMTWSGRFLGLCGPELPEVVIIEFFE